MHRLPRISWAEWCEDTNDRIAHGLRLVDTHHRPVEHLDYEPFDDVLEIDLVADEAVLHLLVDNPTSFVVTDDEGGGTFLFVEARDGDIELLEQASRHRRWSNLPDPLTGSYFEG